MTRAPIAEAWWPADPQPSARRTRKHGLVDDLRHLMTDVAQFDPDAAAPADLEALAAAIRTARAAAGALPDLRAGGASAATTGDENASLFERSPLTGRANPLATPLVLTYEDGVTRGSTSYDEKFEGPPGTVHGGFVIAAFDDLVGVAQVASGFAGKTARLAVDLRRPTPLHERIDYEGGVDRVDGRKIWAWGRSYCDGELLAEAEGLLIGPRASSSST